MAQKVEFNIEYTNLVINRRKQLEDLRATRYQENPKSISAYGYKVFSQSDEDGIIDEIFRRIGIANCTFIEIGAEDGLENNTVALLYDGWTGIWFEGDENATKFAGLTFKSAVDSGQLKIVNAIVTPDNVNELITAAEPPFSVDFLSLDIDGNDAHVLKAITAVSPRVIMVEYNGKFGPKIDYCMRYNPDYNWHDTMGDGFGASLKHFERLLKTKNYSLVGCNLTGVNAFFVRNDLLGDHFEQPYTSENHWEPCRFELSFLHVGHQTVSSTFENALLKRK